MAPDLFNLSDQGQVKAIPERPFTDEVSDLEDFVAANPTLLGEGLEIVDRQVSSSAGRIDLLAIDKSLEHAQIAIVELKNTAADVDVLLQVLRYASWVESNHDSVRLLLSQKNFDLPDVDIHPRLVVVAPHIRDSLVELSQYVSSFEFDLIEMGRFESNEEIFVITSRRSPTGFAPAGVSRREEWGWDRYSEALRWTDERIELGKALFSQVDAIIRENGWPLSPRFRKGYIPFQLGGTANVVGLEPRWASGFCVWFKLPKSPDELRLNVPEGLQHQWAQYYKQLYVNIPSSDFDLKELDRLFQTAYDAAAG